MIFINSHSAGYYFPKKRNNNFEYIMNNIHPNFFFLDLFVFMGDLICRLNRPFDNINEIKSF